MFTLIRVNHKDVYNMFLNVYPTKYIKVCYDRLSVVLKRLKRDAEDRKYNNSFAETDAKLMGLLQSEFTLLIIFDRCTFDQCKRDSGGPSVWETDSPFRY